MSFERQASSEESWLDLLTWVLISSFHSFMLWLCSFSLERDTQVSMAYLIGKWCYKWINYLALIFPFISNLNHCFKISTSYIIDKKKKKRIRMDNHLKQECLNILNWYLILRIHMIRIAGDMEMYWFESEKRKEMENNPIVFDILV